MWTSIRLARKASVGGAAKFRAQVLQSHETLLPTSFHYRKFSCFTLWDALKSPADPKLRFYSSEPSPENDKIFPQKPVSDVRNDDEENSCEGSDGFHSRSVFDESPFGANKGFGDDSVTSVDSRLDFDERPSPNVFEFNEGFYPRNEHESPFGAYEGFADDNVVSVDSGLGSPGSSEFVVETEKTDDLFQDFNEVASGNDANDETVFLEGEDDNVVGADEQEKTDNIEDMAQKLEDLLSLLQSSGYGKSFESCLEDIGLALNEEFVLRVLETPSIPGENLIALFKWILRKNEILATKGAIDALVRAISNESRARNAYALWDLVKEAGGKDIGVFSTESLNELLSLFSRLGKGKVAFEVFNKFADFGCVPDADTYYFTIDALCKRMIFDWACSVCEQMVSADKLIESEKVGKVVCHLCKGKKLKDAHTVYLWAKDKKIYPSRSAVNFLISSLCEKDKFMGEEKEKATNGTYSPSPEEVISQEEKENVYLALKMLDDFSEKELKHAIKPFSCVMKGLLRIRDFDGAKKLLMQMIEAGPPPGNMIFNSIITGLSKAGDLQEAMGMLKIMEARGLKPDVYSYTVIISGYLEGGAMEEACQVFDEAKKKHSKLSLVTYHSMIRGYCKLEQFKKALELMEEMKKSGLQPSADEYNKLIKSLCLKALDWETATKLLEEMRESGLHVNEKTRCLVRAVKELQDETVENEVVAAAT